MTEPDKPSSTNAAEVIAGLHWLAWVAQTPAIRGDILYGLHAFGDWCGEPVPQDPPPNPFPDPEPPPPPPTPAYPQIGIDALSWLAESSSATSGVRIYVALEAFSDWCGATT